jgi:hypothetical protein
MRLSLVIVTILVPALCCAGPTTTFQAKLHRHKSPQNRVLVDKVGTLTFDNYNRKLTFKGDAHEELGILYDAVTKVVFEVTTHMRGGAASQVLMATGFPGLMAGKAIARQHVHNYWFYLECGDSKQAEKVLLEVPSESSKSIIDEAKKVFGSKVSLADYTENGEQLDPAKLPAAKSKDILKVNKRDHPLPQLKTDKALVVVVCPPLAARFAGRGNQFRLHANDQVIAVNKQGTYSFAFLAPGTYRLVSQSENAYGFDVELEAGKSYYFLQNTFDGIFKSETSLSRNSPELVMYFLDGSYYADWKAK